MSTEGNTDSGRILRELSAGRLKDFRKPLGPASSAQQNQTPSVLSANDQQTVSSLDPNDENLMMSTRHNFDDDSHILPKLRTTAQNYRFYNPPEPQQHVPTSAVNRAFQDFDHNTGSSDDDSIEVGRGYGRNIRGTPSKLGSSDIIMQLGDSFYEIGATPKGKNNKGSLRQDTLRRASGMVPKDGNRNNYASPRASPRASRPGAPGSTKSTRFHNASKDTGDTTGYGRAISEPLFDQLENTTATPKRPALGTPRSTGQINTATARSFVLPDVSDLTEFLGGTAEIEPLKSQKDKPRFPNKTPRRPAAQPTHMQVEQVPVPDDEQDIAKALEELQEKVFELEKYKFSAEEKFVDYENEVAELRTELKMQQALVKRGDALVGSNGGSGAQWRMEKTKLEASVHALQTRLERAERKLVTANTTSKRVSDEREVVVAQFEITSHELRELEADYNSLQEQHGLLKDQMKALKRDISNLRNENAELKGDLNGVHERHKEDTRQAAMTDRAVVKENDKLHARIGQLEDALNQQTAELPRLEVEAYRKAEKDVRAKQSKIVEENLRLEAEMMATLERPDERVQGIADVAVDNVTDQRMRQEIKRLKKELKHAKLQRTTEDEPSILEVDLQDELDRVMAQHEEESLRWKAREEQLRELIQRTTARSFITGTGKVGPTTSKSIQADRISTRPRSKSRTRVESRLGVMTAAANSLTGAEEIDISDAESTTDLDLRLVTQEKRRRLSTRSEQDRREQLTTQREVSFPVAELSSGAKSYQEVNKPKNPTRNGHQRRAVSAYEPLQKQMLIKKKTSIRDLTGQSLGSAPMDLDANLSERFAEESALVDGIDSARETTNPNRSNTAIRRRRRSSQASFKEMTSAFIIPDITLQNGTQHTSSLAQHDVKSCTICQRVLSAHPRDTASTLTLKLTTLEPVSSRPFDADATERPTQSPLSALSKVLKSLYDEYAHYQLQLTAAQQDLAALDPSASHRKRAAVHERITKLNDMLATKGAQIYALFDVVEAHKQELQNGDHIEEDQELSRVVEELRKAKKIVGFVHHEHNTGTLIHQPTVEDDEDSENDAPWEGIVTETVDLNNI